MAYHVGDRVKLTENYVLDSGTIPKGTKGTVTRIKPITGTCDIDFDDGHDGIMVPVNMLAPA